MSQTLDFLRGEYDYVIVDCPATLDETNLAVIEGSNLVYLIATPEIGAVRDLSRFVDSLMQNSENKERLKVIGDIQKQLANDSVNAYLFQLPQFMVSNKKLKGLWSSSPIFANDMGAVSWQ